MPGDADRQLGAALPDTEREREYSPSSCIGGNYQPFIEAYIEQSARARAQAQALGARWCELHYGRSAAQRMDLCVPAHPRSTGVGVGVGVLVFIHGGYWQELSARDSLFAAAHCVEHGLAFCAIDYTLAPAATVGGIVTECRNALSWLAARAAQWGIDATRIVVAGSSAGAHLAAMACLAAGRASGGCTVRPLAAVLLSGLYQLEPLVGTSINAALGLDAAEARAQSPALHALSGFPPALVCWGQIETAAFKAQSHQFAGALQAAGTACLMLELAGRNHFDLALDLADPGTALGRHTLGCFGAA